MLPAQTTIEGPQFLIQKGNTPTAMESLRLIFPDGTRVAVTAPLAVAYSAGDAIAFMRKRVSWQIAGIARPSGIVTR
jgi:hypothetical protein